MISRNFFGVIAFHKLWKNEKFTATQIFFSSNQFIKIVNLTEFLRKNRGSKIPYFPQCGVSYKYFSTLCTEKKNQFHEKIRNFHNHSMSVSRNIFKFYSKMDGFQIMIIAKNFPIPWKVTKFAQLLSWR